MEKKKEFQQQTSPCAAPPASRLRPTLQTAAGTTTLSPHCRMQRSLPCCSAGTVPYCTSHHFAVRGRQSLSTTSYDDVFDEEGLRAAWDLPTAAPAGLTLGSRAGLSTRPRAQQQSTPTPCVPRVCCVCTHSQPSKTRLQKHGGIWPPLRLLTNSGRDHSCRGTGRSPPNRGLPGLDRRKLSARSAPAEPRRAAAAGGDGTVQETAANGGSPIHPPTPTPPPAALSSHTQTAGGGKMPISSRRDSTLCSQRCS